MNIEHIGSIRSEFKEPDDPEVMRKSKSTIIVDPEYEDGLYKIEDNDYIQVIFYFDRSEGYDLIGKRRGGVTKGVFASCSPKRPSPLGITVVKLLSRKGRELNVKGLDALDNTPVVDIKPYVNFIDDINKNGN
ncbi:MAG: tRNA (N6-threonylcarbamoyladenosine(37)-N6)-methyltransferase TrmO [Methanohalophilus sp.]